MRKVLALALVALAVSMQSASAAQWDNYNQPGVVMDNVISPTNHMYDGWGSWYDDGTGMMFHGTNVVPPNSHPTNPPGHGHIPGPDSIFYKFTDSFFDNSPFGAQGIVENAFALWDDEIDHGLGVVRNPNATLGFDWARSEDNDPVQIEIQWLHQAGTAAAWVDGYPNLASFAVPKLQLTFVDQYWSAASGQWEKTNFDLDLFNIPPDPGAAGSWDHPYDLFSTALHELGHLAGLDDLYNLDGNYGGYEPKAFPGSTMGTPCVFGQNAAHNCIPDPGGLLNSYNPYHRYIDTGSLQGVIDLYTVPEPGVLKLVLLSIALAALVRARRSIAIHPNTHA